MPKSVSSFYLAPTAEEADESRLSVERTPQPSAPSSPTILRRQHSGRASDVNLRSHVPPRINTSAELPPNEHTSLLSSIESMRRPYTSGFTSGTHTPRRRPANSRQLSAPGSLRISRDHSRTNSFTQGDGWNSWHGTSSGRSILNFFPDDRVWYDQFTSTDWVHDSIADGHRVRELRKRRGVLGRAVSMFDAAEGWIIVAIIGVITASLAYLVDITETAIFDYKEGYCTTGWHKRKTICCFGREECEAWRTWSEIIGSSSVDNTWIDFIAFIFGCVILSVLSCCLTLLSKHVVPSNVALSTLDENLAAERGQANDEDAKSPPIQGHSMSKNNPSNLVYYSAAGSGVAEVKVILSGFVLHGYLGLKTLILKTAGLILSVASGLSLGKEGPYVHVAACVGNIACRMFSKYNLNDGKRREVLSAAAASGVAVAFGSPISGILFSLEEVSYYFPSKTLFRTFFCCIVAALFLKFLDPYGTGKIVIFEVRYTTDWQIFELIAFVILGVLGGALGALFIKTSRFWAKNFRRIPIIKRWPMLEVLLVAVITGLVGFWNRYTKLAVTELLLELASPCGEDDISNTGLCPQQQDIPTVIRYLFIAFIIKSFLTTITFGIKVPAGIYVPSMVVGGLMGRIVGHATQYLVLRHPDFALFQSCPNTGGIESCVTPGVYALVAAGATMCGVTRLSVTLAVILFELTGSLNHVLPFSLAVLTAKWTADAIEPLSIYDLLIDMNQYPFLHAGAKPVFDTELGDIVPRVRPERIIDISETPLVPASELRLKLQLLHAAGELDGGLPILRNNILVGLLPAPDLEFALDTLAEDAENKQCLMATDVYYSGFDDDEVDDPNPTDLTPFVDPAPIALDIHSPMDLVYQCFVKLGIRYVCVLREGEYTGMVHKKAFVKYIRELEQNGDVDKH